jgi:hypothetical protein
VYWSPTSKCPSPDSEPDARRAGAVTQVPSESPHRIRSNALRSAHQLSEIRQLATKRLSTKWTPPAVTGPRMGRRVGDLSLTHPIGTSAIKMGYTPSRRHMTSATFSLKPLLFG